MVGKGLRQFAEPLGFEYKDGLLFGDYKGYDVTLSEGMGYKQFMIGVALAKDDPRWSQILGFIQVKMDESKIKQYGHHAAYLYVSLIDKVNTMKRFTELLDQIIDKLREAEVPGNSVCWYCSNELSNYNREKARVNQAVVSMHGGCIDHFENKLDEANRDFNSQSKNYARGTVGAILGGIVGVIPWVIVYMLGFFVGYLGLLIGLAAKKGYEIAGGRAGRAKVWIVVLVVIFSVFLGQFVAETIDLVKVLHDEGITDFALTDIPPFLLELVLYEPEYRRAVLVNVGLGLLFAFLGIFGLFREIKQEGTGNLSTVKRLG